MSNNFGYETTADEVASLHAEVIQGKTVLITGCTWGGLGAEAARAIAKQDPKLLILAGRKQEALDDTVQKIKEESPKANLRTLTIDLASLESVKKAAAEVNQYSEPIDVLINNAAIMASPYHTTEDGFEASSSPRIANVSSGATRLTPIRFDDPFFKNGEAYNKRHAYGQSKTANILFARELAKRYGNNCLSAFSLHPDVIKTNLGRSVQKEDFQQPVYDALGEVFHFGNIQYKSLGQGAATHLVAAFDPSIEANSGSFLADCQVANDHEHLKAHAKNDEDADKLWTLSETLVGQKISL